MLIQVIGAFFSVVAFSFLLHVPRKYIIWAGFTGAVGWWIYLVLMDLQFSMAVATFLSGCLISLCGQFFARILKTPVTIFVATGIDTFLGVDPYVAGSSEMGQWLTEGVRDWVEAAYTVETDIEKLVDKMIDRIEEKRTALGCRTD